MSYDHIIKNVEGIAFHRLFNRETGESVEVIPELGGTVASLRLRALDKPVELLAFDEPAALRRNPLFRGRFLFPFNDRIPGARYTFNNISHQLPVNSPDDGAAIHGFLYEMPMHIKHVHTTVDAISMTLETRILPVDFVGYPFSCDIAITYVLTAEGLQICFQIANSGETPCPFALGWHPYFRLGDGVAQLRADYENVVEVDADLLPTRRLLRVADVGFDFRGGQNVKNCSIDLGFTAPSDGVTMLDLENATVEIRQDNALFSYTQLYIPEDRQSIAIEPITAATNSFNYPELGLRVLSPEQTVSGDVRIRFVPR